MKAIWHGEVIAESEETVVVDGNVYFPRDAVREEFVRGNDRQTVCPWKGVASYLDVVVDDKVKRAAAWYYPDPLPAAAGIAGRVAFWRGVRVVDDRSAAGGAWRSRLARLLGR